MPAATARQTRAERLSDERERIVAKDESLTAEVNQRVDSTFTDAENDMRRQYRERLDLIDAELADIADDFDREKKAAEASSKLRGHIAEAGGGGDLDGDQYKYRTFAAFARDKLIADVPDIAEYVSQSLGRQYVDFARERYARAETHFRTVEHTLSSHVDGLIVPAHLNQIMDVINKARPVVQSARRVDLSSGSLTWPKITQRPTVRPQGTEKTETLSRRMIIEMESATANTYLGSGNLSWQSVQWSTPSALETFFDLLAEDYAAQTEAEACHTLAKAAATIGAGSLTLDGTDTFDDWLQAIVTGFGDIYTATRKVPDTLYLSPDAFLQAAVITSDAMTVLVETGSLNLPGLSGRIAALNVVSSPEFVEKTAIVGVSDWLFVGETPGAPVRMQVIEPDIAGYLVGVVGAFRAVSFDDNGFADIGAAT